MLKALCLNGRQMRMVLASVLLVCGLSTQLNSEPALASPLAQIAPTPRPTATPRPTPSMADLERDLREVEKDKIDKEILFLRAQRSQVDQQREAGEQIWRAPAEAISMVGPTFVALLALALVARLIDRAYPPPPRPERPAQADDEDEEL